MKTDQAISPWQLLYYSVFVPIRICISTWPSTGISVRYLDLTLYKISISLCTPIHSRLLLPRFCQGSPLKVRVGGRQDLWASQRRRRRSRGNNNNSRYIIMKAFPRATPNGMGHDDTPEWMRGWPSSIVLLGGAAVVVAAASLSKWIGNYPRS